jgi:hypothetical protein
VNKGQVAIFPSQGCVSSMVATPTDEVELNGFGQEIRYIYAPAKRIFLQLDFTNKRQSHTHFISEINFAAI